MPQLYYVKPSEKIFKEVKDKSIMLWKENKEVTQPRDFGYPNFNK